jgi:hypothetical protein
MFRATLVVQRKRSAWRDLLHPLSKNARQSQWQKRDLTERNEEVLRRPYYTLHADAPAEREAAEAFRTDVLTMSDTVGPQLEAITKRAQAFAPGNAARLRPNYPESIETLPPQNHLRSVTKAN